MGNSTKKEGKFSFRCSEDKKSIEMFNRMELIVNNIEEPNPEEILTEMQNDV